MTDFVMGLLREFVTWQVLFLALVVMFLTESVKKSTQKFIRVWIDSHVAEKDFQLAISPNGKAIGKEKLAELERKCRLRYDGVIDFTFSWFPVLSGIFFSVFVRELFPGVSTGMRICNGILAGAGSSIVYKIVRAVVKYYTDRLTKGAKFPWDRPVKPSSEEEKNDE